MADYLKSGTQSENRRFGAVMSKTTTKLQRISGDGSDPDAILSDSLVQSGNYGTADARIVGIEQEGDCSGLNGTINYLVELSETEEAWPLNVFRWEFRSTSSIEKTTVDIYGSPIVVQYPPSLDWAQEIIDDEGRLVASSRQYTEYESQTAEVDVYVTTQEITGTRYKLVTDSYLITYLTNLYGWKDTINSTPFFGHPRGCVLCLGCDISQLGIRENGDHLLEQTYRFITRPGRQKGTENGWNSWAYWKDPTSGMVPEDIESVTGAVVESRHYWYRDHSVLYNASEL